MRDERRRDTDLEFRLRAFGTAEELQGGIAEPSALIDPTDSMNENTDSLKSTAVERRDGRASVYVVSIELSDAMRGIDEDQALFEDGV